MSPFWSEEDGGGPIQRFIDAIRERNALSPSATLHLLTEGCANQDESYKPTLPESFLGFDARSFGIDAVAVAVDPRDPDPGDGSSAVRRLHAKAVLLEGENTSLVYVGSANFTRHGWGFLGNPTLANIEAGTIVRRRAEARKQLRGLMPKTTGQAVALGGAAAGQIVLPEPSPCELPWPAFLQEALLSPSEQDVEHLDLILNEKNGANGPWSVSYLGTEGGSQDTLFSRGTPGYSDQTHRVTLSADALGRLLKDQEVQVRWEDCPEGRAFPLNVACTAKAALPISPGSGRPEEAHLIAYYQGRISWEDLFPDPEIALKIGGPLTPTADKQGVDTSRIQSYIVREFVEALRGVRDDLRRAATAPKASMRLALLGPVSPVALARRVVDAADARGRTPTAAGFQLVEILVCLDEATHFECLPRFKGEWLALLDDARCQVAAMLAALQSRHPAALTKDFRRYANAVRKLGVTIATTP